MTRMLQWLNRYNGDYHAVSTITLQELEEIGFFDWNDESWSWRAYAYDDGTYNRLCEQIYNRYKWREISVIPPLEWKELFLTKIKYELCPRFNRLYKIYSKYDDYFNDETIFNEYDKYGKSRDVGSEFPETLLNGNSVYASDGKDTEFEEIKEGNKLDKFDSLLKISDVNLDKMFVDELESFFNGVWVNDTQSW